VDGWAAVETLPSQFQNIQSFMTDLVQKVREDGQQSSQGAIVIAMNFIKKAPTYSFDGMDGSLNVTDVLTLKSNPVQYAVIISFDCGHPGYGDRSGQILPQMVAHHVAEIVVANGIVTSAIIDSQWDEIKLTRI
jgi:hypothetical protein